jgi:hypothetical protein
VDFTFNQNVRVAQDSFQVTGPSGAVPFALSYESITNTATLNFGGILGDGNYTASTVAAKITNAFGQRLLADLRRHFSVLAADADRDGKVDFNDLAILAQNYNTLGGMTFGKGDFNYDGNIDFDDLAILAQRYNTPLPPVAGEAAAVAGATSSVESEMNWQAGVRRPAAKKPPPAGLFNAVLPIRAPPRLRFPRVFMMPSSSAPNVRQN